MKHDNTWDLRVTKDMVDFYNKTKKEGNNYFWNFNLSSATTLVDLLSKAYQVNKPDLSVAENLAFPNSFRPAGFEKIPKVNELMGVRSCSPYLADILPS